MTDACFLCDDVEAPIGALIRLDGPEGRHAARVRRIRVGESLLLADGRGSAVRGVAQTIGDDHVDVLVQEHLYEPERPHRWTVVQALAKGGRDEAAIEAMTELGVDAAVAWQADRSVVKWDGKTDKALAKWGAVVREAAKQSRRFTVPPVRFATTTDVCASLRSADQAFVLHESAGSYLDAEVLVSSGDVVFVVGPEGGITEAELAAFEDAGAKPVLVADHVLRTSTAGVVALAQLQVMSRGRD